jgi:UDP-N-acetylglucosamine--N-acetylmuramyl-(pentapeptide) pyrophosphoryl-undecaprenol N-acetylglucosamine transferase
MASLCGYRSAIWEPNAMPGMANRFLAKFVDDCWVVFEEAKGLLKSNHLHRAGMPVRAEIETRTMPSRAGAGTFNILVFGGSQGARGISNAVLEMVRENPEWMKTVKIVHQTGGFDFARIREGYAAIGSPAGVEVREYLHDMPEQYANADVVICRSGTGTLSELAACGKPSILIPLPTAADDHQRKNAESLVAKGAAVMLLQKDLNPKSLFEAVENLRRNPSCLAEMSRTVREFHSPHAAETLVGEFVERIENASR